MSRNKYSVKMLQSEISTAGCAGLCCALLLLFFCVNERCQNIQLWYFHKAEWMLWAFTLNLLPQLPINMGLNENRAAGIIWKRSDDKQSICHISCKKLRTVRIAHKLKSHSIKSWTNICMCVYKSMFYLADRQERSCFSSFLFFDLWTITWILSKWHIYPL